MAKATTAKKSSKKAKPKKAVKISYHRRPGDISLDLWQLKLRKQFGEDNPFEITNMGDHPIFSEFSVWNPTTRNSYRVEICTNIPSKGLPPENTLTSIGNFCTCQDFKTNRLGLCKHISAVLHKIGKQRGAKKAFKEGYQSPVSAVYVDYRHEPRIRLYVCTEHTEQTLQLASKWFDDDGFILPDGFAYFEKFIEKARKIQPSFKCYPDAYQLIAERRENIRRRALLSKKLPGGANAPYFDNLLKVNLFPFQKVGVHFAANAGRCLIADEMGLGKTIQAIGAAEMLRREMGIQKAIVVCPTSLKYQWKTEVEKFSGATVNVVEGTQTKRIQQYETDDSFFQIVSYNTVANDAEYLRQIDADLLIIDEAQRIKNFRTKVSMQLKKVQTPYCFVLTGTPLENKLEELYAVTQFVDQHKLPPLYRFLDRYQIVGENGQVLGYKNLKEIGMALSDCLIRRQKKEVLKQLPKRMDKTLFVPMTQQQKEIHRELADNVARLVAKWRRMHFLSEKDRLQLILSLSQMRMVCDSTYILDQQTRFDTKIDELLCIFEEALADPEQKIVIFSQWERMTRLVAQELDSRGVGYANLHGGIPSAERAPLLDRFRDDPDCRVFLSTDAGSVGLNLQSAAMVINLDIPWNPAVLEQRIARIHRMGQKSNVTVINMVATESIEHRMLGVLEFKAGMAQGVLDPDGDDTIFMSETKFKKFMDNVESLTGEGWQQPHTPDESAMEMAESEDFEAPPSPSAPLSEQPNTRIEPAETFMGDDDVAAEPSTSAKHGATEHPATTAPQSPTRTNAGEKTDHKQPSSPSDTRSPMGTPAPASPQELVQAGVSFFAGLAQTLSNPEKTQELVQSIVAKDEQTGQTYLKIPVESAAMVENAVKLLGGLLSGLSAKGG
ncbi:MAG: DEAD/DEAH box helicase family protein [Saprospiraceae bacterium]|nr:DEAD/DEAH box helicase family protein [Saprospiraceae bacterium]